MNNVIKQMVFCTKFEAVPVTVRYANQANVMLMGLDMVEEGPVVDAAKNWIGKELFMIVHEQAARWLMRHPAMVYDYEIFMTDAFVSHMLSNDTTTFSDFLFSRELRAKDKAKEKAPPVSPFYTDPNSLN